MKKYIAVLLFAVAFVVSAMETTMLKYAPDTTVGMAEINTAALLQHPSILQTLNDPQIVSARQEWEQKSGVRLTDWKKIVFFIGADGNVFSCLCVDKSIVLEKILKQNGVQCKELSVNGRTVYQLPESGPKKQSAELAELAPGVILVGEKGRLKKYFAQTCGNVKDLAVLAEKASAYPVWLAFINHFRNAAGKTEDPKELLATFRFTGKEQKDLEFKLQLLCNTSEGARMLKSAIPMYAMMGLGFIFGSDPELSSKVIACIKPKVSGNDVTVLIRIKKELADQIAEYLKQNSDQLTGKFSGKKGKKRTSGKNTPSVTTEQ